MERIGQMSLIKPSNELQKAEQPSSLDLAIAQGLDEAMQIYKTDPQPGEVRVWQNCFRNERPEALAWGFRKYFKTGVYPPKPVDIANLILFERESDYFDGWYSDLKPKVVTNTAADEYRKQATDSRQEFFKSPEYQQFLERMKKEHGI